MSVGVNSFLLCLSDDSVDAGLNLYQALKHCSQLGTLAVVNADTHPGFAALVSFDVFYRAMHVISKRSVFCLCVTLVSVVRTA